MDYDPLDRDADPFKPPEVPTDPTYRDEHGGWMTDDSEDEEFTDEELAMAEEEELRELDAGEEKRRGQRNGRHDMRDDDMPF